MPPIIEAARGTVMFDDEVASLKRRYPPPSRRAQAASFKALRCQAG